MWEKDWSELCSFTVCLVTESYALGESKYRYSLLHIVLSLRKTGTAWEQGSLGETITISLQTHSMNSFHGIIDILHKSITEKRLLLGIWKNKNNNNKKVTEKTKKKTTQTQKPKQTTKGIIPTSSNEDRAVTPSGGQMFLLECVYGRKKEGQCIRFKESPSQKKIFVFYFSFSPVGSWEVTLLGQMAEAGI